jgi:hypothetical protein
MNCLGITMLSTLNKERHQPSRNGRNCMPLEGSRAEKQPNSNIAKKVLRCLVWVETTSGGQTEVKLSGDEIDDGGKVSNGAIAASLCLGGLYEAVDSLDESIGDLAMEPA